MSCAKPLCLLLGRGSKVVVNSSISSSSHYTGRQKITGGNVANNSYCKVAELTPQLPTCIAKQSQSRCVQANLSASNLYETPDRLQNTFENGGRYYPSFCMQSSRRFSERTSAQVSDTGDIVSRHSAFSRYIKAVDSSNSNVSELSVLPLCKRRNPNVTPSVSCTNQHRSILHHKESLTYQYHTQQTCQYYICSNRTNNSEQLLALSDTRHQTCTYAPWPRTTYQRALSTEVGSKTTARTDVEGNHDGCRTSTCITKTRQHPKPTHQQPCYRIDTQNLHRLSETTKQTFLSQHIHAIYTASRSIHTARHPDSAEIKSADDCNGGPTITQMTAYLKSFKLDYKMGFTCVRFQCPFCDQDATPPVDAKTSKTEQKNVYINKTTGWTTCQCTKATGSWKLFQNSFDIMKKQKKKSTRKSTKASPLPMLPLFDNDLGDGTEALKDKEMAKALWEKAQAVSECEEDYLTGLAEKFSIKKLKVKTLERFQVRVNRTEGTLLVPMFGSYDKCNELIGITVLDVKKDANHQNIVVETPLPKHESTTALFGYKQLEPGTKKVILTECVLDAMAVHQETGQPVISLPHRAAMLPQQVLPLLEHFKSLTLWFNNDLKSWDAYKQFSKKLYSKRCHLVRPLDEHPSALTALNQSRNLKTILNNAMPVSHKSITSFRALREEVLGELCHADQVAGVKWKRFVPLNKLLKGHRRGELTVFTGPTGAGKTTFMAEYSLDLCMQGVNTLWGSFEIKNVRLAKVMLNQFTRLNMSDNLDKFDESADKFELLPLYFMDFHGQQSLKKVLEAMSHAAYVHDIQHIIVDNLQFLVGYSDSQTSLDRFSVYDKFISAFRKFATYNNCHVTLVIHPRKERESEELQTSSIFGSAKASQEADNVLILQDQTFLKPKSRKYIQVAKNRFDGECGRMPLLFNKDSLTMSDISLAKKKTLGKPKEQNDATQRSATKERTTHVEDTEEVLTSWEDFFEEYTVGDDVKK